MSFNLPLRTVATNASSSSGGTGAGGAATPTPPAPAPSRRNQDSRNYYTSYSPSMGSSTEAIDGPVREPAREAVGNDRLIVGVDFGTTFSG